MIGSQYGTSVYEEPWNLKMRTKFMQPDDDVSNLVRMIIRGINKETTGGGGHIPSAVRIGPSSISLSIQVASNFHRCTGKTDPI